MPKLDSKKEQHVNTQMLPNELEKLYQMSPFGLCKLDRNLCFLHHNHRLAEIIGKPVKNHVGRRISEVLPELSADLEAICRKVFETGKPVLEKDVAIESDGEGTLEANFRISCLHNEEKDPPLEAVNMIVEDITPIVAAEKQIDERLTFEKFITELSASFVNLPSREINQEIEHGLNRVAELLELDVADIAEVTPDDKIIGIFSYKSPAFIARNQSLNGDYNIIDIIAPSAAKRLHKGELVKYDSFCDFPAEETAEREYCEKLGIVSHLSIPLIVGGVFKYCLILESSTSKIDWPEELIQRLQLVGEIFTNAMERNKADSLLREALSEINDLKSQIEAEWTYLQEEIKLVHNFEEIIGESDELQSILHKIQQIAPLNTSVLILGETGTGKELVARAIHNLSPRNKRPMVKVNCAALPSNLIESELFGHEKGAFSGAYANKVGRFELANGSTLFLDEIGELPLELQPKLLRVLQGGEFERLGGTRTIRTDVRLITATNRNLEEEVKQGRFRQDLWYRLNVFPITAPPLRQRKNDIALLVNHFVQKFGKRAGRTITKVPAKTIRTLERYNWPGNVRELENVIERAVINNPDKTLRLADRLDSGHIDDPSEQSLKTLAEIERDHIVKALAETNGRVYGPKGAALILGLNPETLRFRIRKLGIKKEFIIS